MHYSIIQTVSGRDDKCCFCACVKFLFEDEVLRKGSERSLFWPLQEHPPEIQHVHWAEGFTTNPGFEASQKLAEEYLDWLKREVIGKEVAIESSMMMLGNETRTHPGCISYEVAAYVQLHWRNLSKAVQIAACSYSLVHLVHLSMPASFPPSINPSTASIHLHASSMNTVP